MRKLTVKINLNEWELIPFHHRSEEELDLYFLCFNIEVKFKPKF